MAEQVFRSLRGMRDLWGAEADCFEYVMHEIRQLLDRYGYQPFHPPMVEYTELFSRSVGAGTDVVEKEMFTFDDAGDSITLRPEATAGVVRAVIQNGLTFGRHKLWTAGPMFRRERPQKGRYRQFHQVSVEAFGVASPELDAEHIMMTAELWQALGIGERVKLSLNTLATQSIRERYRSILVSYFNDHLDSLDADSERRLTKNPLRILDSKHPQMADIIASAPKLKNYLDDDSKMHFERVQHVLNTAGIEYRIDTTLVRGMDYYNHTVYEWGTDDLGAQSAICGGGRYDNLVAHLGGKATPAVGFGLGIDRIMLLMQTCQILPKASSPLVYLVLAEGEPMCQGLMLARKLRRIFSDHQILTDLSAGSLKSQFKKADQSGARYAIVLGYNELQADTVTLKNLRSGHQASIRSEELIATLVTDVDAT